MSFKTTASVTVPYFVFDSPQKRYEENSCNKSFKAIQKALTLINESNPNGSVSVDLGGGLYGGWKCAKKLQSDLEGEGVIVKTPLLKGVILKMAEVSKGVIVLKTGDDNT